MIFELPFSLIDEVVFEKVSCECGLTDFVNSQYLQHPYFGTDLTKYYLINFFPQKFKEEKVVLHYNMYYWFLKFKHKFNKVNGHDAGIEQQLFKIIEESETIAGLDWSVMQFIQENAYD